MNSSVVPQGGRDEELGSAKGMDEEVCSADRGTSLGHPNHQHIAAYRGGLVWDGDLKTILARPYEDSLFLCEPTLQLICCRRTHRKQERACSVPCKMCDFAHALDKI